MITWRGSKTLKLAVTTLPWTNCRNLQKLPVAFRYLKQHLCSAVYQVFGDNDGQGIMFETEGDTLANTFSSDYGNYSDGFRKAFHHENISYVRRKDREYVNLKHPRLSALLTRTPKQVQSLITDAENGLLAALCSTSFPPEPSGRMYSPFPKTGQLTTISRIWEASFSTSTIS